MNSIMLHRGENVILYDVLSSEFLTVWRINAQKEQHDGFEKVVGIVKTVE